MVTATGKNHQKPNNGISFWAFLLSIFIYISIFYIFNLSPLNLLNSTKFWFFISNTLIIIIAADFGAFFSSRNPEIYIDNYLKKAEAKCSCFNPSFECYMQRPNVVEIKKTREKVIRETVTKEIVANNKEMESVTKGIVANNTEIGSVTKGIVANNTEMESVTKGIVANNTEMESVTEENEEKKKKNGSLQRSLSERYSNNLKNVEEENNEFSDMSVEELNRRVEEFIQRFNRQIRLQAASRKLQN